MSVPLGRRAAREAVAEALGVARGIERAAARARIAPPLIGTEDAIALAELERIRGAVVADGAARKDKDDDHESAPHAQQSERAPGAPEVDHGPTEYFLRCGCAVLEARHARRGRGHRGIGSPGDLHRREGELDAVLIEAFLDQGVGPALQTELLVP